MKKPEDVEQQLKQQLNASVDALPESVTNKLAAARLKAVQAAKAAGANRQTSSQPVGEVNSLSSTKVSSIFGASSQKNKPWAKPVWAMAASLCVMVPLWYASQNVNESSDSTVLAALDSPLTSQSTTLSALDIMSTLAELDEDEMELLDNLEFAIWLSEQEQAATHG